ncbi:MAG: TrbG/VirB9 family P-type conjugative transfer protein [Candidatus Aminicenantes bacterium]|nr:TrbG/VirB9 family P-type conjugative transfer protein [Candidatus Aminicenantes bacterium]
MIFRKILITIMIFTAGLNAMYGNRLNYKVLDAVCDGKKILKIGCETNCTTMFVLPPEEMIADIIEPTGEWIINCDNKRFIYVVPLKRGIYTSLDLITRNSKIYSFILEEVSIRNRDSDVVKKVIIRDRIGHFNTDIRSELPYLDSGSLWERRIINNRYKIRDKNFKVDKVEDDGILTRVYLPRSQIRPAVFIKGKGKRSKYEPVRYSDVEEYYIIHRIIKKNEMIILKAGKYESIIRRR